VGVAVTAPNSLEVALRGAKMSCGYPANTTEVGHGDACRPDYEALAAAAREWMKRNMPMPFEIRPAFRWEEGRSAGYNRALADVAKALGLEP